MFLRYFATLGETQNHCFACAVTFSVLQSRRLNFCIIYWPKLLTRDLNIYEYEKYSDTIHPTEHSSQK